MKIRRWKCGAIESRIPEYPDLEMWSMCSSRFLSRRCFRFFTFVLLSLGTFWKAPCTERLWCLSCACPNKQHLCLSDRFVVLRCSIPFYALLLVKTNAFCLVCLTQFLFFAWNLSDSFHFVLWREPSGFIESSLLSFLFSHDFVRW